MRSAQLAYEIRAAYAEVAAECAKRKLLAGLVELNANSLRLTEARVKEGDLALLEASLLKVEISRTGVSGWSAQGRFDSAVLELPHLTVLSWYVLRNKYVEKHTWFMRKSLQLYEPLLERALRNLEELPESRRACSLCH
jgi:hypothetical protein